MFETEIIEKLKAEVVNLHGANAAISAENTAWQAVNRQLRKRCLELEIALEMHDPNNTLLYPPYHKQTQAENDGDAKLRELGLL